MLRKESTDFHGAQTFAYACTLMYHLVDLANKRTQENNEKLCLPCRRGLRVECARNRLLAPAAVQSHSVAQRAAHMDVD